MMKAGSGGFSINSIAVAGGKLLPDPCLDVDGNNSIDALTDGLVILRAMFGLTGAQVTNAAIGAGATRSTWADVRAFLNGSCGSSFGP